MSRHRTFRWPASREPGFTRNELRPTAANCPRRDAVFHGYIKCRRFGRIDQTGQRHLLAEKRDCELPQNNTSSDARGQSHIAPAFTQSCGLFFRGKIDMRYQHERNYNVFATIAHLLAFQEKHCDDMSRRQGRQQQSRWVDSNIRGEMRCTRAFKVWLVKKNSDRPDDGTGGAQGHRVGVNSSTHQTRPGFREEKSKHSTIASAVAIV